MSNGGWLIEMLTYFNIHLSLSLPISISMQWKLKKAAVVASEKNGREY